jgi:hypothetical protein
MRPTNKGTSRRCWARSTQPNLEWTYLDPSEANPEPRICHGRGELEIALRRQLRRGLSVQLDELIANGARVMVTVRIPGVEGRTTAISYPTGWVESIQGTISGSATPSISRLTTIGS